MKKLNFGIIADGLNTLQNALEQNSGIGWSELVDASAIDFAEKNSYAMDDTDETIRDLADQIEVAGLLSPLGVIKEGNRYRLFSGERRYKAITTYLHWEKIPCQVFEGVSPNKAQLMLHMANGAREYSPARKLELYEEYNALLREMKANGEFTGPIQKGVAELLNVSDRQVRTYRTMAEQLTQEEKEDVSSGSLSFGNAKQVAAERAAEKKKPEKTGTGSGFSGRPEKKPSTKKSRGWNREKIAQIILPDVYDDDPHPRLLCGGDSIHCGEIFRALLPDGCWHDITLEISWDVEGLGCWYISNPEYQDVCPIGLFVKKAELGIYSVDRNSLQHSCAERE